MGFSVVRRFIRDKLFTKRRIHGYCVGASKTGTTSIAKIFGKRFRASHEGHVAYTSDLVRNKILHGERISLSTIKHREELKRLEFESNSLLGYLSSELSEAYPEARFLLTVREPIAWIKSCLKHHLRVEYEQLPEGSKKARDVRYDIYSTRDRDYETYIDGVERWSLELFLRYWNHQNKLVIESVADDRLLIIKTSDISSRVHDIEDFFRLSRGTLPTTNVKYNSNNRELYIDPYLASMGIFDKVEDMCSETLALLEDRDILF
jgi:hypothetical protein